MDKCFKDFAQCVIFSSKRPTTAYIERKIYRDTGAICNLSIGKDNPFDIKLNSLAIPGRSMHSDEVGNMTYIVTNYLSQQKEELGSAGVYYLDNLAYEDLKVMAKCSRLRGGHSDHAAKIIFCIIEDIVHKKISPSINVLGVSIPSEDIPLYVESFFDEEKVSFKEKDGSVAHIGGESIFVESVSNLNLGLSKLYNICKRGEKEWNW